MPVKIKSLVDTSCAKSCWPSGHVYYFLSLSPGASVLRGKHLWSLPLNFVAWYTAGLPWYYCWCPCGRLSRARQVSTASPHSPGFRYLASSKPDSKSGQQIWASTRESPTTTTHHFLLVVLCGSSSAGSNALLDTAPSHSCIKGTRPHL